MDCPTQVEHINWCQTLFNDIVLACWSTQIGQRKPWCQIRQRFEMLVKQLEDGSLKVENW